MKRTPAKIQVHSSHKLRSHHPTVPNMRATTILVYVEGNDHALGKVTNDNGRTGEMRVVGNHMWRYEVCGATMSNNGHGFPSAEEALTALMEELGLP